MSAGLLSGLGSRGGSVVTAASTGGVGAALGASASLAAEGAGSDGGVLATAAAGLGTSLR